MQKMKSKGVGNIWINSSWIKILRRSNNTGLQITEHIPEGVIHAPGPIISTINPNVVVMRKGGTNIYISILF